jgi:hypothetical protein
MALSTDILTRISVARKSIHEARAIDFVGSEFRPGMSIHVIDKIGV